MTQTETAILIATATMYLFGAPFFLLMFEALATDNQTLMAQIIPLGFGITFFGLLVLIAGVWLDSL